MVVDGEEKKTSAEEEEGRRERGFAISGVSISEGASRIASSEISWMAIFLFFSFFSLCRGANGNRLRDKGMKDSIGGKDFHEEEEERERGDEASLRRRVPSSSFSISSYPRPSTFGPLPTLVK